LELWRKWDEMARSKAKLRSAWRIWAKAIGTKEGVSDKEADAIAMIRTFFVLLTVICEATIIAYDLHKW